MESLIHSLKEGHKEVMEQTGMGELLSTFGMLLTNSPDVLSDIKLEVKQFFFAVNWREPFFAYVGLVLVAITLTVLYLVFVRWQPVRPRPAGVTRAMELAATQAEEKLFALSMTLIGLAFAAYPLNKLGIRYGDRLFVEPGVNYFDDNAFFIGIIFWLPLVILSVGVQGKMMFNVVRLMVHAKREQLAMQRRRQAAVDTNAAAQRTACEASGKKRN